MEALISMKGGAFGYTPETTTFRDIDFSIRPGEVLCILGPNGCGKTTLLDTLLGYHRLRSGEIRIDGRDADNLSARERAMKVAYVPQNHEKSFPYTVKQVIQMGRAPHLPFHSGPGSEDRQKVDEIIDRMKLSSLRNKEYTRLSGGETQLVLIARALVQESQVMILDEPTSHLDFTNELVILETLVQLADEHKIAVIMASHVPNHAFYFENRRVSVRVALMQNGHFSHIGPPGEVLTPKTVADVYNVDARIISYACGDDERPLSHVIPLKLRGQA
jgi:iron complex transport system ATP-binding protein